MTRFTRQTAERIVQDAAIKRGYCLILGGGNGRLALELARRTELLIYVVEPDADKASAARKALTAAGLYGSRVCVDQRPLSRLDYPEYFANLIVCEDSLLTGTTSIPPRELLSLLKPHGGIAYVGRPAWAQDQPKPANKSNLQHWLDGMHDGSTEIQWDPDTWARISRAALPGAGQWTHQYAAPATTTCGS